MAESTIQGRKAPTFAPSKSTVYLSNVPFSLTNNDVAQLCEEYGTIARVTIVKDKETHKSKGVVFIQFSKAEEAQACVNALNQIEFMGRTLKCSLAVDNGRAAEFIKKKRYDNSLYCFECRETGHKSYSCPKNILGPREKPESNKPASERSERGSRRAGKRSGDDETSQTYFDDDDFDERPIPPPSIYHRGFSVADGHEDEDDWRTEALAKKRNTPSASQPTQPIKKAKLPKPPNARDFADEDDGDGGGDAEE